jgi:predicted CoA-binding protein
MSASSAASPTSRSLGPLLRPRSIAVLGASPRANTLGNNAVANLVRFGFAGGIYPVHPSASEVASLKAYANLASLPEAPDCAVLALSADKVLASLEEAAGRGVRAAVVFASGFAETGPEGRVLQDSVRALYERTGMVICGPNCLGLVNVSERISLYSSSIPESICADAEAYSALLARLSAIGAAYSEHLEAMDLNPVAVLPEGRGVRILDALIIPRTQTH